MGDTRDLISPQFPNSVNQITGTRVLLDTVIDVDISSNVVEDPVHWFHTHHVSGQQRTSST